MVNNTTDINNSKNPKIVTPIEANVNGIEKYRISLNVINTKIPITIPAIIRIIPGIPKYFKG